jgi:hypothetical protein
MNLGPHPSHVTRFSDASSFDEICINCGAHDEVPGGWGHLAYACPNMPTKATAAEECEVKMDAVKNGRVCVLGTEGCIVRHTNKKAEKP